MPQTTSASYNIGNSRQSARSNSFNRRNSGEFANQQRIIAERLRLVNEAKLLRQKQLANRPKLAILFNPNTYPVDALNLMNFIKDDTSASRFTIINYTDLEKTLEEQYNLGFRFFASPTIGSFALYTYCIPFCKKYPDSLLFTTYSTQYFEDGVLPFNIIRSSVNDKDMIHYIVNEILYKVHTLTKESAPVYYKPISDNTENSYLIFSKIAYIYTEKDANGVVDTYSEGYKEQLSNEVNLQNGIIEFKSFKITDDNFILPEEVKTLLSENPVSGEDFQYNDKTIFILNSYSPEKILQLFDEEYMYDNYFIFGDVFPSNHYTSNYKFKYAICPVGNYSFEGFKTAGFVPNGQDLSPFLYSICDVILKLLPYYTQIYYKYPNFSSNEFNLYFINRMKQIKLFVNNNQWYERKIFTYYITTKDGDFTNAQYREHIFFKFQFNPNLSGQIIPKSFIYNFDNTYLLPFDSKIHCPIINDSNSFFDLKITTENFDNKTEVTIKFQLNNDSVLLGNDGLSFKNVVDYYKNTSITISDFNGIPLSKAGEQFANLSNLEIKTNDCPNILPNTSLKKAFYNCTIFNSDISNWDVSNVINMDSMFENANKFSNYFYPLNWNCNSLTSAVNFGLNSSLYGEGGDYNINSGNGVRSDGITSIETPTKTLIKSNISSELKSGSFVFSISDIYIFDENMIPIINSASFLSLTRYEIYDDIAEVLTITINYTYYVMFGNDGLSFKNVIDYYKYKTIAILQFGGIPLSKAGEYFSELMNLTLSAKDIPSNLLNASIYLNNMKGALIIPNPISKVSKRLASGINDFRITDGPTIYFNSDDLESFSSITVYLCGGGGSGGNGGTDSFKRSGTNGSGGSGSDCVRMSYSNTSQEDNIFTNGFKINIGAGGQEAAALIEDGTLYSGRDGNDGSDTRLLVNHIAILTSRGGHKGFGGHKDRHAIISQPYDINYTNGILESRGRGSGNGGNDYRIGGYGGAYLALGINLGGGGNGSKGVNSSTGLKRAKRGQHGFVRIVCH